MKISLSYDYISEALIELCEPIFHCVTHSISDYQIKASRSNVSSIEDKVFSIFEDNLFIQVTDEFVDAFLKFNYQGLISKSNENYQLFFDFSFQNYFVVNENFNIDRGGSTKELQGDKRDYLISLHVNQSKTISIKFSYDYAIELVYEKLFGGASSQISKEIIFELAGPLIKKMSLEIDPFKISLSDLTELSVGSVLKTTRKIEKGITIKDNSRNIFNNVFVARDNQGHFLTIGSNHE